MENERFINPNRVTVSDDKFMVTGVDRDHYDYDKQCYITNGRVTKCGHPETLPGCYACEHVGEKI